METKTVNVECCRCGIPVTLPLYVRGLPESAVKEIKKNLQRYYNTWCEACALFLSGETP
jgi:hypothetical protein